MVSEDVARTPFLNGVSRGSLSEHPLHASLFLCQAPPQVERGNLRPKDKLSRLHLPLTLRRQNTKYASKYCITPDYIDCACVSEDTHRRQSPTVHHFIACPGLSTIPPIYNYLTLTVFVDLYI